MQLFRAGQSVELDFNTNKLSDGSLVTFASGAVKIYRGSDTTGSSTGVTLTIDAGGTGEHHVTVSPLTAAAYLLPGNIYTVRATAGTIDSVAATDAILATFKVERMSAGIEFVLSANAVGGGTVTDNGLMPGGDVGDILTVESGSFPGQPRTITAWNKSTGVFTVSPNFDNAPGNVTVTVYPQPPMPTTNVPKVDLIDSPNATALAAVKTAIAGVSVILSGSAGIKKNTALNAFSIVMTDATTHTPKTGLTVTAQVSLNGAAFVNCTNAVTELSNGVYLINLAAADLNGATALLKFTAAGADQLNIGLVLGS